MCDFSQREFSCGHFLWLASELCPIYKQTRRKWGCQPNVTKFETRDQLSGECKWVLKRVWRLNLGNSIRNCSQRRDICDLHSRFRFLGLKSMYLK
ncbi:hypothetical protein N657DRAFT_374801 [Parathielavia appendiculata]|uniref:Uncharacterized protein n=1 Tax=Parathielavia appendiculata TaxID=2587402 RepID=A0AAN6TQC7_9PEZI|nr:hypothetical protein N657DRAFT_374801 [Parathielavia appendiculata]